VAARGFGASPDPLDGALDDRIAALQASADAVVSRAMGVTVTPEPAPPRPGRPDPARLLAAAAARAESLGALPPAAGLPPMTCEPMLRPVGPGLAIEVQGPRRGEDGPLQLHYASVHYGESFPHRLVIRNRDFMPVDGVAVELLLGRYSSRWSRTLGKLSRGQPAVVEDIRMDLDVDRIRALDEADTSASLEIRVHGAGKLQHTESIPVEVLAFREWRYDLTEHPDALACFVQPNAGALQPVLAAAARRLREIAGDDSLCGYQKPAEAHWPLMITLALHDALQAAEVRYINPPASFEHGQKIRLPGDVLSGRMGTCLDLAVLWASLLEATGLHPVLVVVQGHAFQGVWLEPICLSEPWTDRLDHIVEAMRDRKLLLFNSTTFTKPEADLGDAIGEALACLTQMPFRCLVDVQRARMGDEDGAGVRPLP
jgi:hypothetical protein